MARASRWLVVAVVVAVLAVTAVSLVLRERLRCAGFPGPTVSAAELPPPAAADELRIATWNLRNFPLDERPETPELGFSRRTNICDLEAALGGLDADLLALQEVCDTRRFPPIVRRAAAPRPMATRFSAAGGRFGQHLGFAWNEEALELVAEPVELDALVLEPGMRPGYAARFRSRQEPALDFTAVTVHLEAGRQGFAERRRQNRALTEELDRLVAAAGDPDLLVLGDFNTAGSPRGGLEGEMQSLTAIFARAGLEHLDNGTGCTQYWEGRGERDGVQVPSTLDHVFIGGRLREAVVGPLRAWLHCERLGCAELVSRPGAEDGTFWDVSDHCPLTFEIRVAARDGGQS